MERCSRAHIERSLTGGEPQRAPKRINAKTPMVGGGEFKMALA